MKLAIHQTVSLKNRDEYSDWLAGQEAIKAKTGFIFSAYKDGDEKAYAYYSSPFKPEDVLPVLDRGQSYVWVNKEKLNHTDVLFKPTALDYYRHMTSEINCSLSLTRDESATVLKAYDYGVSTLNQEEMEYLNSVLAKLKDTIHP